MAYSDNSLLQRYNTAKIGFVRRSPVNNTIMKIDKSQCKKRRDHYQFHQQNKNIVFRDDFTIIMVLVYYWNEKIRFILSGFSLFVSANCSRRTEIIFVRANLVKDM